MAIFWQLPRVIFRTQPKFYGGAFLQKIVNDFKQWTFFAKKLHQFMVRVCPKNASVASKESNSNKLSYMILPCNFI